MSRLMAATALLALLSAPAFAQAPICGGISLVGAWVGDGEAGSDITTRDEVVEMDGQVPVAGHLVRMFTLSRPGEIRIDVRAQAGGDPYMSVFDVSGTELASDDDSAGNLGSRIQTALDAGTYCLAVRSYETGVTDVSVAIGMADADFGEDPFSSSDSPAITGAGCFQPDTPDLGMSVDAEALAAGIEATASASAAPAYGFTLAEAAPITVTARSANGDPVLRLLDADGSTIAENDDFDGLDSRIDMTAPLPAGAYCLEVEDYQGGGADITVALRGFDPKAYRLDRLARAEFAPMASDEVEIADLGTLDTSVLRDVEITDGARWFRFDLPEGGLLLAEAVGDGEDPVVTLFDRVGRKLGENDDGPDGLDSFLVSRLLPGTYTLAVRLIDTTSQGRIHLLLERYIAAE